MVGQPNDEQSSTSKPSATLLTALAVAGGALVANIYYAQPLTLAIGPDIGISVGFAGAIVGLTQVGYGFGLFLLVPLADLVENRRLVLAMMALAATALAGVAVSNSLASFLLAVTLVGLSSTCAQILLPWVAHLTPTARRGRIVGNVMAGVLAGIMLARPISSFIAAGFGWRAVYWFSCGLVLCMMLILWRLLPVRRPQAKATYGSILLSMIQLFGTDALLRRRCMYQTLMFCVFNLFWTASPLALAEHFGLDQHGIGLFALAGAGGALAAPVAGRLADGGWTRLLTVGSMLVVTLCFLAAAGTVHLGLLFAFAIVGLLLDAAVQGLQVVNQRIVFSGPPETRGRANAIYTTIIFAGGSLGPLVATLSYQWGGWTLVAAVGAVVGLATMLLALREPRA